MSYTLIIARASWTWRECIYLVSSKGILRIFQLFSFRTAPPLIAIAWATWIPFWWCRRNIPTWLIKHPTVQGLKIVLTLQKSERRRHFIIHSMNEHVLTMFDHSHHDHPSIISDPQMLGWNNTIWHLHLSVRWRDRWMAHRFFLRAPWSTGPRSIGWIRSATQWA